MKIKNEQEVYKLFNFISNIINLLNRNIIWIHQEIDHITQPALISIHARVRYIYSSEIIKDDRSRFCYILDIDKNHCIVKCNFSLDLSRYRKVKHRTIQDPKNIEDNLLCLTDAIENIQA